MAAASRWLARVAGGGVAACSRSGALSSARKLAASAAVPAPEMEDVLHRVILTFSGKVSVSSGSEIWSRIAHVMKAAGADIEAAGGTFVRMASSGGGGTQEDALSSSVSFSVSAFGAQISPAVLGAGLEDLGCAMYLKAILPQSRVTKMMSLLRTGSPLQVYTVCSSPASAQHASLAKSSLFKEPLDTVLQDDDSRTGTVHLFGADRPGQLSRITQLLRRYGATVMQLRVQTSAAGGAQLSENRVRIVFDHTLDEVMLRRDLQRTGQEVGYAVTCLTTDTQARLRATLPSYVLRKKAFTLAYQSVTFGHRTRRRAPPRQQLSARAGQAWQDLHRRRPRSPPSEPKSGPGRKSRGKRSEWHI